MLKQRGLIFHIVECWMYNMQCIVEINVYWRIELYFICHLFDDMFVCIKAKNQLYELVITMTS